MAPIAIQMTTPDTLSTTVARLGLIAYAKSSDTRTSQRTIPIRSAPEPSPVIKEHHRVQASK
jgi:hypothetical protein